MSDEETTTPADGAAEVAESNPIAVPEDAPAAEVEAEAEAAEDVPAEPEPEPEPELLHGVPVTYSRGQTVLHPTREEYRPLVESLRDEGYWMCVDLCGVDYLTFGHDRHLPHGVQPERFEVVVMLINHTDRSRLRLRVQVPAEDPRLDTLFALHPSTENPEREAFDMFGISFDGHPDMTRILMPDEWDGHPLRKDYDVGRIPVQFKGVSSAR